MSEIDPKKAKEALEKRKSERDRISGKLDSLYEELSEMGFANLDNIDQELDILEEQINEKEQKRDKKLKSWKKKYGHYLEELEEE